MALTKKDFITLFEYSAAEVVELLNVAALIKQHRRAGTDELGLPERAFYPWPGRYLAGQLGGGKSAGGSTAHPNRLPGC